MTSFQSVLVPVDLTDAGPDGLSAETEAALAQVRWIVEAGAAAGGEVPAVCLMTVLPDAERSVVELLEHRLQHLIDARLKGVPGLTVSVHVSTDQVFVGIIRKVLADGHDLVVVGPRSTHRRHPGVVGSTTLRLLRKCPCPVWIAARPGGAKPGAVLSAVALHDTMPAILELSAGLCKLAGAAWHVLHVPEYPAEGGMRLRCVPAEELDAYKKEVREACWKKLHAAVDPIAQRAGLEPKLWMSEGIPSEKIEEAAGELSIDVIVMATVAKHGLAGLLLGSTADKVFSRADRSLLVIKPDDFVCPVKLGG